VVDPDGRNVRHAQGYGSSNPAWPATMPSEPSIRTGLIKPNSWMLAAICLICRAYAYGDLEARFELARVFIFDGQRPHSAPPKPDVQRLCTHELRIKNIGKASHFFCQISHFYDVFPIIFYPES
jgi:hypothetical protein